MEHIFVTESTVVGATKEECEAVLASYPATQDLGASTRQDTYVDHDGATQVVEIQIYTMAGGHYTEEA